MSDPLLGFLLCCVTSFFPDSTGSRNLFLAALSDEALGSEEEGTEKWCECLAEIKWEVTKPENPFLGHAN